MNIFTVAFCYQFLISCWPKTNVNVIKIILVPNYVKLWTSRHLFGKREVREKRGLNLYIKYIIVSLANISIEQQDANQASSFVKRIKKRPNSRVMWCTTG